MIYCFITSNIVGASHYAYNSIITDHDADNETQFGVNKEQHLRPVFLSHFHRHQFTY